MSKFTQRTRRRFAQVGSGTSLCLRYRMPQEVTRLPDAPALSRDATQRLRWMDYARTHSVAATCRHFGIARSTFYRWQRRSDPQRLSFFDELDARTPFPIRALQIDGGSEFMAEFETACQQRGMALFVLPPRFPQAQWACRTGQPHAPQ